MRASVRGRYAASTRAAPEPCRSVSHHRAHAVDRLRHVERGGVQDVVLVTAELGERLPHVPDRPFVLQSWVPRHSFLAGSAERPREGHLKRWP